MPASIISFNLAPERQVAVTKAVQAAYDALMDGLAINDEIETRELIVAGALLADLHRHLLNDVLNDNLEAAMDGRVPKAKAFKQQHPNGTQA